MTLYKKLEKIIEAWEQFLTEIETKMQSAIKEILNEIVEENSIFAIFFEYEYDIMNLSFFATDNEENPLLVKQDILSKETNCKTLFPNELLNKQYELVDEYDGVDENFDEIYDEYTQRKQDIFKKWFKLCWDKVTNKYKKIPNAFFSIHDTNWKYNLSTNEKIKHSEIFASR